MYHIALRIDEGNTDMGTEGSVAKLWGTEAGNRAADAAIQALGGYGYAREYVVEKMRRDVRITSIYEGTSEIQQVIIAMNRWKETVRTKGAFYEEMATAMDTLHGQCGTVGADLVAAAIRGVNDTVQYMHAGRLTRHQIVMFTFADMMTVGEVAGALAEKAAGMLAAAAADADAEHFAAMSRVFARKAVRMVKDGAERCVVGLAEGSDGASLEAGSDVLAGIASRVDPVSAAGLWTDMALVGEALKNRD